MIVPLVIAAAAAASVQVPGLERIAQRSNPTLALADAHYKGRAALKVMDISVGGSLDSLVTIPGVDFGNGAIELDVAGLPAAGAAADARGFIGVAFRVQDDPSRYEAFYIRPTNGRADDQLRRNHATQYIGMPEYPWHKLRKEQPGVYESYADMVAGAWTRLRVEVDGAKARFYVNGAEQPTLIVNDLKLGAEARGGIALWIGPGTEGYFAGLKVTPKTRSAPPTTGY